METTTPQKVTWYDIIYPFKHFWAFLLANLAVGLMIPLVFSFSNIESLFGYLEEAGWSFAFSMTQWMGHAYIASFIDLRISWLERPVLRAVVAVLSMTAYTVIGFVTVSLSIRYFVYHNPPTDLWYWVFKAGKIPMIAAFVIGWGMAGRGFYVSWRDSEKRARNLQMEMLNYRYEALRNQINPHFLFNSFNVLSDLVYEDQELAVKFIRQLSDLYRYVLDSREKEKVPLREELEFIDSFVFLLKTRFEDKLEVEIDLQPEEGEMIVPMTLQLLIENAVKHNVASKKKPLQVRVSRSGDRIEVRNPLQRRMVGEDSKKIGLKNLEQQYTHLSGKTVEVTETEDVFMVSVPIIKTEAS